MAQILIETYENDYMEYFENASYIMEQTLKGYSMNITKKRFIDAFIASTKANMLMLNPKAKESFNYLDTLSNSFEVWIDEDIPKNYSNNVSHVYIILPDTVKITDK